MHYDFQFSNTFNQFTCKENIKVSIIPVRNEHMSLSNFILNY